MSYCRFGHDSDVYVIGTGGGYQCVACRLMDDDHDGWYCESLADLFHHMMHHISGGHKVPDAAMDRIVMEQTTIANDAHNAQSREILSILLFKLTLPNTVFEHLVHTGRVIEEMKTEFKFELATRR